MRALLFFYYLCRLNFNNVKLESMIHFLEQNFVELVTITSMIYLMLAVILFLFKTPDTKVYKPFRRSKSLMAGGMLLISLNIWIWIASFTGSWTEYNNWVPCFDIILFYLMGICFSFSLSSLLDPLYLPETLQGDCREVRYDGFFRPHRHDGCPEGLSDAPAAYRPAGTAGDAHRTYLLLQQVLPEKQRAL